MDIQSPPPAKAKLLDAAKGLMLAKGYTATTVEEICAAAGLTKGSFFHYFKSKEDLGRAVLDYFIQTTQQAFRDAPFHKKRDPLQRVYGYVDFTIQMSQSPMAQHGCLLGNFAQELSDTHEQLRQSCCRHFKQWADGLQKDLELAKARHVHRPQLDTRSLAEHFIAVIEGALILAKVRQDTSVVKESLGHFKRYLKSLFR